MKRNNKKGFTIVELVIVIAVIAILAAVLIPTFSSVIKNAKESSAMQACRSAYSEAYADAMKDGSLTSGETATSGDFTFTFTPSDDGAKVASVSVAVKENSEFAGYTYTFDAAKGTWTATTAAAAEEKKDD